jgi:hypothetical protein
MAKEEARDGITRVVKGLISSLLAVVDKAASEAFAAGETAEYERLIRAIGGKTSGVSMSPKPAAVALKRVNGGVWIKKHIRKGKWVPRHFRPLISKSGAAPKASSFTLKLKALPDDKAVRLTHFGLKRKAPRRHMGGVEDGVIKLKHHLRSNSAAHINAHQIKAQLKPLSTGTIFRTILALKERGVLTRVGMGEYSVNQNKIAVE